MPCWGAASTCSTSSSDARTQPHRLTPFAKVSEAGEVSYPVNLDPPCPEPSSNHGLSTWTMNRQATSFLQPKHSPVSLISMTMAASITGQFEFQAFKPLPCGCVAAMHRTLDPGLNVVSLEAKGATVPSTGMWWDALRRCLRPSRARSVSTTSEKTKTILALRPQSRARLGFGLRLAHQQHRLLGPAVGGASEPGHPMRAVRFAADFERPVLGGDRICHSGGFYNCFRLKKACFRRSAKFSLPLSGIHPVQFHALRGAIN